MNGAIKAVYDCMVLLQAAARPNRMHGTMRAVAEGRVHLCVSDATMDELRDVLTRPELREKFPSLTIERAGIFIEDILSRAQMVRDVPAAFGLPRDRKDEPYLNLAIAAHARFLVTWNQRHLTYLMSQDTPEGQDFCRRFSEIQIVDPPSFLAKLR